MSEETSPKHCKDIHKRKPVMALVILFICVGVTGAYYQMPQQAGGVLNNRLNFGNKRPDQHNPGDVLPQNAPSNLIKQGQGNVPNPSRKGPLLGRTNYAPQLGYQNGPNYKGNPNSFPLDNAPRNYQDNPFIPNIQEQSDEDSGVRDPSQENAARRNYPDNGRWSNKPLAGDKYRNNYQPYPGKPPRKAAPLTGIYGQFQPANSRPLPTGGRNRPAFQPAYDYYNYRRPSEQKQPWGSAQYSSDYDYYDYDSAGFDYDETPADNSSNQVEQLLKQLESIKSLIGKQNRQPRPKPYAWHAQPRPGPQWGGRGMARGPQNRQPQSYQATNNRFSDYDYYPADEFGDRPAYQTEIPGIVTPIIQANTENPFANWPTTSASFILTTILQSLPSKQTNPTTKENALIPTSPQITTIPTTSATPSTTSIPTTLTTTTLTTTTSTTTTSTTTLLPTTTLSTTSTTTPRPTTLSTTTAVKLITQKPEQQDDIQVWLAQAEAAWAETHPTSSSSNRMSNKMSTPTPATTLSDTEEELEFGTDYAKAAEEWAKENRGNPNNNPHQSTSNNGFEEDPNFDYAKAAQEYANEKGSSSEATDTAPNEFDPNFDYAKAALEYINQNSKVPSIEEEDLKIIDTETTTELNFEVAAEISFNNEDEKGSQNAFPHEELQLMTADDKESKSANLQTFLSGLQFKDSVTVQLSAKLEQNAASLSPDTSQMLIDEIQSAPRINSNYTRTNDTFNIAPLSFLPSYANPCWYDGTRSNRLQCLPSFFVAGFLGCGTEEILESLLLHPQVVLPSTLQPSWWSSQRHNGIDLDRGYMQQFDEAAKQIQKDINPQTNKHMLVTLDASHDTLLPFEMWKKHRTSLDEVDAQLHTPQQLKKLLPGAKFVVALCEPSQRLFDVYQASNITRDRRDFLMQTQRAIGDIFSCRNLFKDDPEVCSYGQPIAQEYSLFVEYLQTGFYADILSEWFAVWPKENFFFIKTEDFKKNKALTVSNLLSFLELTPLDPSQLAKMAPPSAAAVSHYVPVPRDARQRLDKFYSDSNAKLPELLGDKSFKF